MVSLLHIIIITVTSHLEEQCPIQNAELGVHIPHNTSHSLTSAILRTKLFTTSSYDVLPRPHRTSFTKKNPREIGSVCPCALRMSHDSISATQASCVALTCIPVFCLPTNAFASYLAAGIVAYKLPSAIRAPTHKKTVRITYDIAVRHVTASLNVHQLRALQSSTLSRYRKWCKKHKQVPDIDELDSGLEGRGEGGRLLWVGERRSDRVVLFIHGGSYVLARARIY